MRRKGRVHDVFWKFPDPPGWEYCFVAREGRGWRLEGTVARRNPEGAVVAAYSIETDANWRTRRVKMEVLRGADHRLVELEVKDGKWEVDGKRRNDLAGCIDVDLEASPVTNTLPIKRTRLRRGARVELTAAWVRFPSLEVSPLKQSYENAGHGRYIYRSLTGFKAELELDVFGLVRRYGKYWVAV